MARTSISGQRGVVIKSIVFLKRSTVVWEEVGLPSSCLQARHQWNSSNKFPYAPSTPRKHQPSWHPQFENISSGCKHGACFLLDLFETKHHYKLMDIFMALHSHIDPVSSQNLSGCLLFPDRPDFAHKVMGLLCVCERRKDNLRSSSRRPSQSLWVSDFGNKECMSNNQRVPSCNRLYARLPPW